MARPAAYQWQPLGWDSDPVPGDPQAVAEDVQHLVSVAGEIESQIAALRRIASDQADIGKTADKIRVSAAGLVGDLQAVVARCQKLSSALSGWSGDLDDVQSMSLRALNAAEAPYARVTQLTSQISQGFLNPSLAMEPVTQAVAAQQAEAQAKAALQRAQAELDSAVAMLNRAISLRDTQAASVAALINAAASDSLTDSWWDEFSDWVAGNAGWLNDLASALGDVVGVLAVVALLIPGVDLIVAAAIALTSVMLIIHTMLAATGNGGWLNVAFDVAGILTAGAGLWAVSRLESGVTAARGLAAVERSTMLKQALESGPFPIALRLFRSFVNEDGELSGIGRLGVTNVYKAIEEETPELPEEEEASTGWAKTEQQFKTGWKTLRSPADYAEAWRNGGDPAMAAAMKSIESMSKDFSSVSETTEAAQRTVKIANTAFRVGNTAQFTDFGAVLVGRDSYEKFKDDISTYALPVDQVSRFFDQVNLPGYGLVSSQW